MADTYLIDGYNLIHALGMIQKQMDRGGLEASRQKLLDFLSQAFGPASAQVTVVFDAKHAPRGISRTQQFQGLAIRFAPKQQSADDLIETLIAEHAAPKTLVVVSNDMRLQKAAARRGAQAWSHEVFLDFLDGWKEEERSAAPTEERPQDLSDAEKKRWLKEFEDVERDPTLKPFFDHDRFE